jgi:hypothetical protein
MTLSELCVACGLCCDGSLFRFLPVDEAERATYARLGLPVVTQSGRPAMPLPCTRLAGTCCTVYAERPGGCRAYVCRLGDALSRGQVSGERALAVVREARRRIDALRAAFPGHEPVVQRATTASLAGDPALSAEAFERLAHARRWLDDEVHWPE